MATKVQLTGGAFQDSEGNLLASGYLMMKLSQDSNVNSSQICSGIEIRIELDGSGDVVASPAQSVWGNDQLLPINSFYRVTGYKASGQPAWGPNNQQVIGDGGTFDVGTWIPNSVISWTPSPQTPFVKVNGVAMSSQAILDFEDDGGVTWTDAGAGVLHAAASGGGLVVRGFDGSLTGATSIVAGGGIMDGSGDCVVTLSGASALDPAGFYSFVATYHDSAGATVLPITAVIDPVTSTIAVHGDASASFYYVLTLFFL